MKKICFLSLLAVTFALLSATPPGPIPIGSPLPKADLKMDAVNNANITLSAAAGQKGLLVIFSSNKCPYIIKYQSRMIELATLAKELGFGIILLNSNEANRNDGESMADMNNYSKSQGYFFPYALDKNSTVADAFGAGRTPECFLFDNSLKLVYHGAVDDNPAGADAVTKKYLEMALQETASGKAVTITETKSVGCGIKRVQM